MRNLRALVLLYIANIISSVAQGISVLAIPWYFTRSENMQTFGIIFLVTNVMSLFWMPYAGVLVDRFNRQRILVLMSIIGFVVMAASALSGLTGPVPVWVAAAAFMYTFFHFNIHYVNLYAFVQEITEERHYARITPVMEVIHQLTTMLAGAAGAILLEGTPGGIVNFFGVHITTPWEIAAWDLHEIFTLDACTYLVALLFLVSIRYMPLKERYHEAGHILVRLRTGWRFLVEHRAILTFGVASFCVFVTIIIIAFYLNPLYVYNHLGESADVFAASEMYYALGAIVAGAGTLALFRRWGIPDAIILLTLLAALFYAAQATVRSVPLFYVALLVMGLSNAGTRVLRITYLMYVVPNQVYGRTNGIFNMINVLMRIVLMLVFTLPFFTRSNHVIYTFVIMSAFLLISAWVIYRVKPVMKPVRATTIVNQ